METNLVNLDLFETLKTLSGLNYLPHKIYLEIGDNEGEGHNETIAVPIESNLPPEDLMKAYGIGFRKIGVNLIEDVCCSWEQRNELPPDVLNKFRAHDILCSDCDGKDFFFDEFADWYCRICKIGNPNFEYRVIYFDTVGIGGYGLLETEEDKGDVAAVAARYAAQEIKKQW